MAGDHLHPTAYEQSRAARITCAGTVKARFIGNAEVDAAKNVAVEREVRQSHVIAGESVLVASPGTRAASSPAARSRR